MDLLARKMEAATPERVIGYQEVVEPTTTVSEAMLAPEMMQTTRAGLLGVSLARSMMSRVEAAAYRKSPLCFSVLRTTPVSLARGNRSGCARERGRRQQGR